MSYEKGFIRVIRPAVLVVGLLAIGGAAQAQEKATVVPDAQIEANVLKALAGAPQLADQNISTTTVYGTVTLSGTVRDEPTRVLAETLASRAVGVKKVVDELTLTGNTTEATSGQNTAGTGTNPNPDSDGSISPETGRQLADSYPPNQGANQNANGAAPQPGSSGNSVSYGPPYRRPYTRQPSSSAPLAYSQSEPPYGAQQAGQSVVMPSGAMIRVRINQGLDSNHAQPGTMFDGVVVNDVVADGAVAIPRGATVQGTVVDAQASGTLKGRGTLSLQLTQVILGGKVYPIVSDYWSRAGADKTGQTVGNAVGLGAVGAVIGAIAGGGPGAIIGAGVGGAAGVGASAASGRSLAFVPPEAILTFHLTQQVALTTVSQAEMDRLASGVSIGAQHLQRRPPPPPYYYGPTYYRPYYYPYPY
jgi:hypothetical protein